MKEGSAMETKNEGNTVKENIYNVGKYFRGMGNRNGGSEPKIWRVMLH